MDRQQMEIVVAQVVVKVMERVERDLEREPLDREIMAAAVCLVGQAKVKAEEVEPVRLGRQEAQLLTVMVATDWHHQLQGHQ